ncbi:MAG: histidine kinase, partial [Bacteroidales bacterium]|nr:histidine kinase [Bacteroidales bacterium]
LKSAEKFRYSQPDSFIYFIEIAWQISFKLNSKIHLIKSLIAKGGYYLRKGESQKALETYTTSKQMAQELNHEDYINESDIGISASYLFLAYYPLAEIHLIDALKYYEKTKNDRGIGDACLNMTFIKLEQKEYKQALVYAELAYKHYQLNDYKVGIARALVNLCDINMNLDNLQDALEYGRKAFDYTKLSNQPSLNSLIYQNIAAIYTKLSMEDSVQYYFQRSIDEAKIWGDAYVVCRSKFGLADRYARQYNFKKALKVTLESFFLAEQEKFVQLKSEAAQRIAVYYSKSGNFKKAFEYKMIASDITDSLFNEEKYKVQNEIEAIYQTQKKEEKISSLSKEKEIAELKNQKSNYYIFSLMALLLIISLSSLLIVRYNKLNAHRKSIELEQRLLRSQMNPHFIFNAISCIQEFIMDKNPLEASSYLSSFAKLMRSILNNSSREFISLAEEIETLEHYLKLQHLRFAQKFEYKIVVDDKLDAEELLIPPMLAQPFIENAINHGIAKMKDNEGKVEVEFQLNGNFLLLSVTDNGFGFDDKPKQTDHVSMAIQITRNRINNFKKTYKQDVNFEIMKLADENKALSGIKVIFMLPLKYLQ